MKVKRTSPTQIEFRFGSREWQLFQSLLQLYPRQIPPAAPAETDPSHASRELLVEALAESRAQTRRELDRCFLDETRRNVRGSTMTLSLSEAEAEMVLQVLNDIRVGSWVALGSPEERRPPLTRESAPDIWAMELAGHFQMTILTGLDSAEPLTGEPSP